MHEPHLPGENTTRAGGGGGSTAGSTNADSRTGLILTNRAERNAAPWATRREFQVADEKKKKSKQDIVGVRLHIMKSNEQWIPEILWFFGCT